MQRVIDLALAFFSTVAAFVFSLPFWRDNEYFAESDLAWNVYYIAGFILGLYVFYVFIGSLRMLFLHAKEEAEAQQELENKGDQP